jgi:hypothetical protein
MKTYTITIAMDNAAFEDNGEGREVSNILAKISAKCRNYGRCEDLRLQDSNGNYVGEAVVKSE